MASKITGMRKSKYKEDIKIQIYCPYCGIQHIDKGWYAVKPHREHLCFSCRKKFLVPRPTIGIKGNL
jgi:transposase-like protein